MVRELADGRGLMKVSPMTRAILNGEEDLTAWGEEELRRGVRRGKDGRFRKGPSVVPKTVHDELVRRKLSRAYDLVKESVYDAVRVLAAIVNDGEADPAIRVKAAAELLDRGMGKAQQHVSLGVALPKFHGVLAAAIVATIDEEEVVDGEILEAGDE